MEIETIWNRQSIKIFINDTWQLNLIKIYLTFSYNPHFYTQSNNHLLHKTASYIVLIWLVNIAFSF